MNDIKVLVFRFPNVIGPRLTHGVIFDFVKRLEEDPTQLRILGDGTQSKPYIFVLDLINAIVKFRDIEDVGITLYNVGVEGQTSVTKIADIICEKMGLDGIPYNYTGGRGGWKGDVPKFQYDLARIHNAGWYATCNSDQAVERTVEEVLKCKR
jgi:UDP-glucose 4-epimerase